MANITWRGGSGNWSQGPSWRGFVAPGAADSAIFLASDAGTATLDQNASITSVTISAGSQTTLLVGGTLNTSGSLSFAGGTLDLEAGGILRGGTVDISGATVIAGGGIVDAAVWLGAFGKGVTVTAATLAATEAARSTVDSVGTLAVAGTLVLADDTYAGDLISLNSFGGVAESELDVAADAVAILAADTRVTLSQDDPDRTPGVVPSGLSPAFGGAGGFDNQGTIVSDAVAAEIRSGQFFNENLIVLNASTVTNTSGVFLGQLLTWTGGLPPTLSIIGSDFENFGRIIGQGALVNVSGGTFVNAGSIDLGHVLTQGVVGAPTPHVGDVTLSSTLDIAASVLSFSNTGTIVADTIELDGSVRLSDLGALRGTVVFAGTLDLEGATLDSASLAAGSSYVITGTVQHGTILDINRRIDVAGATTQDVQVLFAQAVTLSDITSGSVVLDGTTTELRYTVPTTVSTIDLLAGAVGITDTVLVTGSLTFGPGTTITDPVAGSTITISGGTFVENGSALLDGSTLRIATLDGTGTITITNGGELDIGSIAASAGVTVVFLDGANQVVLPADSSGVGTLGLTLLGLQAGDLIDFSGVSSQPGQVFVQPGGGLNNGQLQAQGSSGDRASVSTPVTGLTFSAAPDSSGGTLLTVACFRHGTRVSTPAGDRPVETLRIGDVVSTLSGIHRRVKWLGRRAYPTALVRQQSQLRPVRVAAGALGAGLPRRNLYLSPLHGLLIDGILVPVAALVNGRTITRARVADTAYVHIELDQPDIILAEGAPSETFIDCDSRAMFDNAREFAELYPGDPGSSWAFPVPRQEEGWAVEAIRSRLSGAPATSAPSGVWRGHIDTLTATRLEGWAFDESDPEEAIELELVAGGRQLRCLVANRYRIDLDRAGIGRAAHGFTAELPGLDPVELSSLHLTRLSDGSRLTP